jgi:dihydropteroate synthase
MTPALTVRGREVALGRRPALMGIVNATPDSFSDGGRYPTLESRMELVGELVAGGATLIDVGGQSGVTNQPEVEAGEEIERVVPLVDAIVAEHGDGIVVSVDTYKPPVAEAVLEAGAAIVNDVSGLLYPEVAEICAREGAGLVIMHNRSRPKERVTDPALYDDVVADVTAFLEEKLALAREAGVPEEAIVLDPGPDFSKTPAQTIEVLRALDRVHALGRPVLLALSRKDFIGALTDRPPRSRLAGTLAAVGFVRRFPGQILRMHDVREVRDYLDVADALDGEAGVPPDLELAPDLRREDSRGLTP